MSFYPDPFDRPLATLDKFVAMAALLNTWGPTIRGEHTDRASSEFYCAAIAGLNRYTGDTKVSEQAVTAIMDGDRAALWLERNGYL